MKKTWVCQWEVVPGDGVHEERFATFAAAYRAMRKLVTRHIDLGEYLQALEPGAAVFFEKYLSDPDFPRVPEEIPHLFEEWEDGALHIDSQGFLWEHPEGGCPHLYTDLLPMACGEREGEFNFYFDYPAKATGRSARALYYSISDVVDYGTSAYPLLILSVLEDAPKTQKEIREDIGERFAVSMERKAVSRHLKLLEALGFAARHGAKGFSRKK